MPTLITLHLKRNGLFDDWTPDGIKETYSLEASDPESDSESNSVASSSDLVNYYSLVNDNTPYVGPNYDTDEDLQITGLSGVDKENYVITAITQASEPIYETSDDIQEPEQDKENYVVASLLHSPLVRKNVMLVDSRNFVQKRNVIKQKEVDPSAQTHKKKRLGKPGKAQTGSNPKRKKENVVGQTDTPVKRRIPKFSERESIVTEQTVYWPKNRIPLPGDSFSEWLTFGDNGNYGLSQMEWQRVRGWCSVLQANADSVAEAVTFNRLVVQMKFELKLESARDCWSKVLPNKNRPNYPVCVLVLMLCTPLVPDTKIIQIFGPLFKDHYVDEDWIIKEGETKLSERFRPLGRQNDSARYVLQAALKMKECGGLPRDYRDLVGFIGVGPKVALVTLQETIGVVQGVPCDVHMCRIFAKLGWIPPALESDSVMNYISKSKKETHNYELCRAAIEGWFPTEHWSSLNQTWAGLGQLLNVQETKEKIAGYIDEKVSDHFSPWRVCDKKMFVSIMDAYSK
jgi:endonuclease III